MATKSKQRASVNLTPAGTGAVAAVHLKTSKGQANASKHSLSTKDGVEMLMSEKTFARASVALVNESPTIVHPTCDSRTATTFEGPSANDPSLILVRRVERLLRDCLSNAGGHGDGRVDFRILEIAIHDARQLAGVDADLLARAEKVLEQSRENGDQAESYEEPKDVLERLFDAINDGDIRIVESCLDVNEGNPLQLPVDMVDHEGNTPLSEAACYGEIAIVKLLLKRRAHPDTRNDRGRTPLWRACYNGHLPVVELLLNNGADKTIPNHLQEEPGKYGTPESRAVVNHWDPAKTLEIRKRIGLNALDDNSKPRQLIRRVSDFTNGNSNALSGMNTGQLVDMLLWDRDKAHKREELARRFQDHTILETSCPEYPIKISLKELNTSLLVAHRYGKTPIIVCNGLDQPDRFLIYSCECIIDAKQLLTELLFRKSKTLVEIQEELKHKLLASMETHGVGLSLHIRLGDSACDFKHTFCAPKMFPAEVFGGAATWNSDVAKKHFPTEDVMVQPEFRIVVSTSFSLLDAKSHLESALPFFENMAIIEVDTKLDI